MSDELTALRISWQRSLRAANKSPETISGYGISVRKFIEFLDAPRAVALDGEEETPAQLLARRPVVTEADIHRDHVAAFIGEVLRQWKPATAVARYTALHIWFEWMVSQPDIDMDHNPMYGMRAPTIPEEPPPILSAAAIRKMIDTCDPKTFIGLRDEAIIRLFADTGIRCGELQSLKAVEVLDGQRVPTIDLDTESVYVMGKGRRPRTVAFGAKTTLALDRYVRARRRHPHRDLPDLWLLGRNERTKRPLSDAAIRKMIAVRAQQAGVGHVHPHDFRHAWADAMKRSGLDRGDLKNQGGWRSDKMVERYGAFAATERALKAHRRRSWGDEI